MNIKGQNIELTAIEPEDYKRMTQILEEQQVKKYLFGYPSRLEKMTFGQWVKALRQDKMVYYFAVRQRRDGRALGICAYQDIDYRNGSVALWFALGPKEAQKGYGEQVLSMLADNAFDQMRMEHISFYCMLGDEASAKSAKRAGFTMDMVLKSRIKREDRRLDIELYSLIKEKGSG